MAGTLLLILVINTTKHMNELDIPTILTLSDPLNPYVTELLRVMCKRIFTDDDDNKLDSNGNALDCNRALHICAVDHSAKPSLLNALILVSLRIHLQYSNQSC